MVFEVDHLDIKFRDSDVDPFTSRFSVPLGPGE